MKKFIAFLLSLILLLGITACNQAKFKVKIADNYEIVNELKTKYSAGEEVTKYEQKGHSNPQQVERTRRRE